MESHHGWPGGKPPPTLIHGLEKPAHGGRHRHHHYAAHLSLHWLLHHCGIPEEDMSQEIESIIEASDHETMSQTLDQIEAILFLHTHHLHPLDYAAIHTQLAEAQRGLQAEIEKVKVVTQ